MSELQDRSRRMDTRRSRGNKCRLDLSNLRDHIAGWHEAVPLIGKLLCGPGRPASSRRIETHRSRRIPVRTSSSLDKLDVRAGLLVRRARQKNLLPPTRKAQVLENTTFPAERS